MAIVSISRIQHRRGLRADLPTNLNEAEFGWCLDTRQLFIGNGNTYTGNSQILTQWSPNDQLITHAYQGSTGVSAQTVPRRLGSILDDQLDVRDYGAVGDGSTDDTAAIQAAIADQWSRISNDPLAAQQSRNVIWMPAGTYVIKDTIRLWPYCTLQGEGQGKTIILMSSGSAPALRTADSEGQISTNIGIGNTVLPTKISLLDLSVVVTDAVNAGPVLQLERCTDVTVNCELRNSWQSAQGTGTGKTAVLIQSLGMVIETSRINLIGTTLGDSEQGLLATDPITDITLSQCYVENFNIGAGLGTSLSGYVDRVRVTNSTFKNGSVGIEADTIGSCSSVDNSFTGLDAGVLWTNVCTIAQSLGDTFDPMMPYRVINLNPGHNLIWNPQETGLVNNTPVPWITGILPNQNQTPIGISFDLLPGLTTFTAYVDYALDLGSYRKSGRLSVISDGITAAISDTATELNMDASVTFGTNIGANMLEISYTSTGIAPGNISYILTSWTV